MNDKQLRFCEEYLIDLNATQAAIRAGYSPKTVSYTHLAGTTYKPREVNFMKKELNPIEEYATQIVREINQWNYILENGCNDPFWPDGTNLNLTRNHIISYKREDVYKRQAYISD